MDTFINILNFLSKNWAALVFAVTTLAGGASTVLTAVKTKNWTKLKDSVNDFILQAEQLNVGGVVKKEIVLAKAMTFCVKHRIKFDEQKVDNLIESLVGLTKAVNARDKDKLVTTDIKVN